MQCYQWELLSPAERNTLLERPVATSNLVVFKQAQAILDQVRAEGDEALFALTEQFDGLRLASLKVNEAEMLAAEKKYCR